MSIECRLATGALRNLLGSGANRHFLHKLLNLSLRNRRFRLRSPLCCMRWIKLRKSPRLNATGREPLTATRFLEDFVARLSCGRQQLLFCAVIVSFIPPLISTLGGEAAKREG